VGAVEGEEARATSGRLTPQSGQANFSLQIVPFPCPSTTRTSPSDSLRHNATESASRPRDPSETFNRSTTTSMSCLRCLSREIGSAGSLVSPSTTTREKPSRESFASSLRYSPCAPDDRRPQLDARPVSHRHHGVDDLRHRLPADLLPAGGAVNPPDGGEQQPQVVVDLRDRPDVERGFLPTDFCSIEMAGRAPRSRRRRASPSARGTGGRRRRAIPRTVAAPRRRSCRRRATISRSPRPR